MKIMLLTFPMDPVGLGQDLHTYYQTRYLQNLVKAIEQYGWSADVYTGNLGSAKPMEEQIGARSKVIRLIQSSYLQTEDPYIFLPNYLTELKNWIKYKDSKYKLIHSSHWYSGWLGRHLQHYWHLPHIHAPFDLGVGQLEGPELNRYSPLARRIMEETRTFSTADAVVVGNAENRELIWRKYGLRSVDVQTVPAGIDTQVFNSKGAMAERAGGKRIILYAGDFDSEGLHTLAKAFGKLLNKRPRLGRASELWVLGNQPPTPVINIYQEQLNHCLQNKAVLRFLGLPAPQDRAALFNAADVCFLPAADEATSLAALEAMACGCPVMGLRTKELRQFVLDGETGLLVRPEDSGAIEGALERLLFNLPLRKRMGQRAAAWVQESFNFSAAGELWNQLYQEIVHRCDKQICELSGNRRIC